MVKERKKRSVYDWEAIEKDYRIGQLSVRAIASKYGLSHSLILKNAKKYGWTRNLIKQVNALTNEGLLSGKGDQVVTSPTREDIEAAALTNIQVITQHRSDIRKARELVCLLMGQLEEAANNRGSLINDINETEQNSLSKPIIKAISLPSHASILRDLSMSLKNLIPLEREAFNINNNDEEKNNYEGLLAALYDGNGINDG